MAKKKSEADEMLELINQALDNPIAEKLEKEAIEKAPKPSLILQEAYNLVWSDSEGTFKMVTVGYDLATNFAKIISIEPVSPTVAVAAYKLENIVRLKAFRKVDRV